MLQNATEFLSLISGAGLMLWFRRIRSADSDQSLPVFFRFVRNGSKPSRDRFGPNQARGRPPPSPYCAPKGDLLFPSSVACPRVASAFLNTNPPGHLKGLC